MSGFETEIDGRVEPTQLPVCTEYRGSRSTEFSDDW